VTLKGYKQVKIGPKYLAVPIDWDIKTIGESSILKGRIGWQGLTTKEYLKQGDYYLVTGTNFIHGKIDWSTCSYVDYRRYNQDKYIQIKENDILITKDGTIGKVAIVYPKPDKPGTLNSGIFVLRPLNNDYIPKFMYWILSSEYFKSFINDIKAGSTISHLYQKDFINFQYVCPPLTEQKKIAEILSTVDEAIEKTDRIIEETKQLKKGLMQKLFTEGIGHTRFKETKIGRIPEEWDLCRISDFASVKGGRRVPKGEQLLNEKTDYPYIRVSDFKRQSIDTSELKFIPEWIHNKITRYTISKKDIYISIAGTIGLVGTIPDHLDGANLTENAAKITDFESTADKAYLVYVMMSNTVQKQIQSYIGIGAQPKLAIYRVGKLFIPLPPFPEQRKIAEILSEVDTKIVNEETTKAELEQLKRGLMQVLLTGQVRVKV
jgi:type I restriction enzyme S subunit